MIFGDNDEEKKGETGDRYANTIQLRKLVEDNANSGEIVYLRS